MVEDYDKKLRDLEKNKDAQSQEIQRLRSELELIRAKNKIRLKQEENFDGSTEYFAISKLHAQIAFYFSIVTCLMGIVLLIIGSTQALADKSFEVAIVPMIGAAIAEFIAATVFWVHNKSAQQLNRYYDSLHEIEVFLSSIYVVDLISKGKQDEAYAKILDELFNIQKIKAALPSKHTNPKDKEG